MAPLMLIFVRGSAASAHSGKYNPATGAIEHPSTSSGQARPAALVAITAVKYTGQEYDPETGFYYYNARYYDPQLGVFTTPDKKFDRGAGHFGFNRHMYVAGNPVMYNDPSGHFLGLVLAVVIKAAIGAAIGGTVAATVQAARHNWDFANNWNSIGKAFGMGAAIGAATAVGGMVGKWASSGIANEFGRIFTEQLVSRSVAGSLSGGINALYGNKNFIQGFGGGLLTGVVGGAFSGVSAGMGNAGFGIPSILIDGFGNMASNAVARSMGFSSKSDSAAFLNGMLNGALRVGVRTISAKFSGAEFQRSKYNTVGIAHRDTDIYRDLMQDPKGNALALAYRGNVSKYTDGVLDLDQEGSKLSNMLAPTFNSLSQIHDGWNGMMHAAGNNVWLDNSFLNVGTMLPAGIMAQHLDQASFWNNYETYR